MDAPAQFAASIAQGAGRAQGIKFAPVELETRKIVTGVKYVNLAEGKDEEEETLEGEASSAHVDQNSEDDIPLVDLERARQKKRKSKMEDVLKAAASEEDFKENKPPSKRLVEITLRSPLDKCSHLATQLVKQSILFPV